VASPPDFGRDLSCVTDLTPDCREVTGFRVLGEAIARRLLTPRGRLIYDPNYGYDLSQFLNADLGPGDTAKITANIQAECLKDERVLQAQASVVLQGSVLSVTATIATAAGPFTLVLSVSAVDVQLLTVPS
jgi:hypothetical protein